MNNSGDQTCGQQHQTTIDTPLLQFHLDGITNELKEEV
jgi:hypothetical protein